MIVLETHIVPAIENNIRLQEYAPFIFKTITTKSGIKKAIKRQEILLEGRIAKTSDYIKENQTIQLLQGEVLVKKVFKLQLEVIYEDDFLAIINKPAGFPTSGNYFKTIENSLPYNLLPSGEIDALPFPTPVHRLDNPTSGLLLVAKTRLVQIQLHLNFEKKKIEKTYVAIVHGYAPESIRIVQDINEKPSISEVYRLKHFRKKEGDFSLVKVHPKTGRTHQIRIHLAQNNLPIVGDKDYGVTAPKGKKGLFLTATGLKLKHPKTGIPLSFEKPISNKFAKF